MEPVCQYCGDENPEWQLHDRATGEPGQAVCGTCLLMLRDAVAAVSPPAEGDDE